jgi:hypothetical protein
LARSEGLHAALENVVLHCLYGDFHKVEVLRLYFLESVPPSEIAGRPSLPKEWVVGYLRRMKTCHSPKPLAAAVRRCCRELMSLGPVVVKTTNSAVDSPLFKFCTAKVFG